jgi:DNA polymerase-1
MIPGQGLKPLAYTEKQGLPQLNKALLERYADTNSMADLMREWAELEKLRGTFITGLNNHMINGRIHTNFKQHGTVTTRLSAHEPNLQQIPARGRGTIIRELFVAGPGKILIVADYDQIELRCAAYLSGDPEMIRVFQNGEDIHRAAAAAMWQVAMEDVTDFQRQGGKGQNFLTLYGGQAGKLARIAGVPVPVAQEFIDRFDRQFFMLGVWKEQLVKEARTRGDRADPHRKPPYVLIPPFGRRRRLPDLYSPYPYDRYRAERQAVNSVVQGFASNIMKQALIDLAPELVPYKAQMLCTVHDEIITQCDTDAAEEVKAVVSTVMGNVSFDGQPVLGTVPLRAKASEGYSWANAKG